jgi:exopolyphosphatase/guanosine-5'-triphosphate,3'-diphosphate pyrophosphatase
MRLGVLDVGSNTVHLLVMDAHSGARPWAANSHKTELRLVDHLDKNGRISDAGVDALVDAVIESVSVATDAGVEQVMAFATSAIRDAGNGEDVLNEVHKRTGVTLEVLDGGDEARLTFLAVRRWFGWSAGRLLLFDIGGGSLELATGIDSEPDTATSLPLGAARLTRDWFTSDPPTDKEVSALRKHVRAEIARACGPMLRFGPPDLGVATSKTFKQLARMAGAAPSAEGLYVRRTLAHADVVYWMHQMAKLTTAQRAELPGVSWGRAGQLLAGAIVADAAMDLFSVERLEICPWALREGLILRWFDHLVDSAVGVGDAADFNATLG